MTSTSPGNRDDTDKKDSFLKRHSSPAYNPISFSSFWLLVPSYASFTNSTFKLKSTGIFLLVPSETPSL
jgi:hypothetical protein